MRTVRKFKDGGPTAAACEDVRCGCGSLLARFVSGAVELKCRRCKSVWLLPVEEDPAAGAPAATAGRRDGPPGGARR